MLNCRIKIDTGIILHVYGEIITRQVAHRTNQENNWNELIENNLNYLYEWYVMMGNLFDNHLWHARTERI